MRPEPRPRLAGSAHLRDAVPDDLPALCDLEARCFAGDRISRRQFRHLLRHGHTRTAVALAPDGRLSGYAMLLLRRGTSLARLYSLAVDAPARGQGLGRALLEAVEGAAREAGCAYLRLEVREDGAEAIALYRAAGYRTFGRVRDYYEDGAAALRLQKALAPRLAQELARVPHYAQSLDFTCGACALMMAMRAQRPGSPMDRREELRLWREATTVFMTSGHGGCGPYGLALAAVRRGFPVEVHVNDTGVPLLDSVRSEEKKSVMRVVHEDMLEQVHDAGVPVHYRSLTLAEMEARFRDGQIPIVLISNYRLYGERVPHWVVVSGFGERFVYLNDPWVDRETGESALDSTDVPVAREDFSSMSRYGRAGLQAVLLLHPPVHG